MFDVKTFFSLVLLVNRRRVFHPMRAFELYHSAQSSDRFLDWYKRVADQRGLLGVYRFCVIMRDFATLGESSLLSLFEAFDYLHRGSVDATDLYVIVALLIAREFHIRVAFLHQHQCNILPYIQTRSGNVADSALLIRLVEASGVEPAVLSVVSRAFCLGVGDVDLGDATNFLFSCYYIQDRKECSGLPPYAEPALTASQ